jgi:hypothetical protein
MVYQPVQHDQGLRAQTAPIANPSNLEKLAAVVLLSGTVRPSKLSTSIGRSVMDLPVDRHRSLLDYWHDQISELANGLESKVLNVRVVLDRGSLSPVQPNASGHALITIERDPVDFRGTGGVLHDLGVQYHDNDYLLVATGPQLLLEPLAVLAERMASRKADVTLVAHRDGTPSGLMLVRCGALRLISPTGFVDMKEQALPRIARQFAVKVVHSDGPTGLPLRTLSEYISAIRMHHQRVADQTMVSDAFAENLTSSFDIQQEGSKVDPTARVIDSVVLPGARVESGAIVVRSLVCPGAIVRRDQRIVDRVVSAPERRSRGAE